MLHLGLLAEISPLLDRVNLSVVSRMDDGVPKAACPGTRCRHHDGLRQRCLCCGCGRSARARPGSELHRDGWRAVTIDWDRETTHVTMTGPVAYVCEGRLSAGLAGLLEAGNG